MKPDSVKYPVQSKFCEVVFPSFSQPRQSHFDLLLGPPLSKARVFLDQFLPLASPPCLLTPNGRMTAAATSPARGASHSLKVASHPDEGGGDQLGANRGISNADAGQRRRKRVAREGFLFSGGGRSPPYDSCSSTRLQKSNNFVVATPSSSSIHSVLPTRLKKRGGGTKCISLACGAVSNSSPFVPWLHFLPSPQEDTSFCCTVRTPYRQMHSIQ